MDNRMRTILLAACLVTGGCGEQPQQAQQPDIYIDIRVPGPTIVNREVIIPAARSRDPFAPTTSPAIPEPQVAEKTPSAPSSTPTTTDPFVTPLTTSNKTASGPTAPTTNSLASAPVTPPSSSASAFPAPKLN